MAELSELPQFYQTEDGIKTLAIFLKSSNGVKSRPAVEHEKRVDYFKGKRLIECLLESKDNKKWPKNLPIITEKSLAVILANELIRGQYFHRSEKVADKKGYLQICQKNVFEETGIYTWMFSGNSMWLNIMTGGLVFVVIGFTLLPIWPEFAKKILWYCSVTFLLTTLSFCLIRFLLFLSFWILGYDFWVFPRLFDETLSFTDSFKPVYTFEKGSKGQGYYRMALVAGLCAFIYWACTQPTEFDGFLQAQKDFIDDLYSGNLIADVAHDHKINLDRNKRVPDLEDLLKQVQEDERIASEASNPSDESSDKQLSDEDEEEIEKQRQDDLNEARLDDLLKDEEASEEE